MDQKNRVAALRVEMGRQGLWGFIVPHADEYQNEYLPACAERLAWITGFSGSAGTAVVMQDEAAIFVDGRYIIQVETQVNPKVFVPHHFTEWPVSEWLGSVLKPGQKLGYDPWLHTTKEVEIFHVACERSEAELVACQANPLDVIWTSRPAPPIAPVVPHPIQFSGKESAEKRDEIGRKLKGDRVDAAVLTAPDSIAWLLNIRGGDVPHTPLPLSFAVFQCDGTVKVFMDLRKVTPALTTFLGPHVFLHPIESFGSALDELGKDRVKVLFDPAKSASWIYDRLTQAGVTVVKGEDPCSLPKACKNPIEIQGLREAHKRDGVAMCRFFAWLNRESLKGSLTELGASDYLEACRRDNDFWQDLSFPTISAFGPNGAIVHYRSTEETNRRFVAGSLYLVDSGAQYLDGTTDITRTVAIGRPTDEFRDRYTRVLKGHIALARALFPTGTTGTQLDGLARQFLWEVGLDYDHGTGHGVGSYLGVHEGPQRISKLSSTVGLQPGMILSNEPGYYKSGEYGIRLENLVVVVTCKNVRGENRPFLSFETVTVVPFDKNLIKASLLTQTEKDWVNGYHHQVRETLEKFVDSETASWLKEATTPI